MKPAQQKAFSLMELLIVILIISVLAAAIMPIIRGKVERAKWTEANAAAGMIRSAVKMYYAESGVVLTGSLANFPILDTLGINPGGLTGTCFVASDYTIDSVNADGIATITVTGSLPNAPAGSMTLQANGDWK